MDIDSHEQLCTDEIFMAGAQCDLRGCVPERWAPVSAAMHYLKTIIQRRLQGTPFVTVSGVPSVYGQTERRQKRSRRWPGRHGRNGFKQRGCVRGRVKVKASRVPSADTVNLDVLSRLRRIAHVHQSG